MKIYAKNIRGTLWDLDTNEEILCPIWFDVEAGLFEKFATNAFGKRIKVRGGWKTEKYKGRIKFIPNEDPSATRVLEIGRKCQSCTRDAKWQVGDETPLPPVRKGRKLLGRGRLTGLRFFCDFHYKGPQIVDAKGEVMEIVEDGYGVRPEWHS